MQCQVNSLVQRQNGPHFTDDILKCIFVNENFWISNKTPLRHVVWNPIDNKSAFVPSMAWRWTGDKPLSDNICCGAEQYMILYRVDEIPDQGNAERKKSLRLKRKLYWIKTLATQFPHGMNHKIVRKRDIFITFLFSNNARKSFKITKDIYTKLQKMYPNIFKGELMSLFKRNKIWVITLFLPSWSKVSPWKTSLTSCSRS